MTTAQGTVTTRIRGWGGRLLLGLASLALLTGCPEKHDDTPAPDKPTILTQPADQTVASGSTATFSVSATGASHFQWRKDGNAIAGATERTYTTPATVDTDTGALYSVVVSAGSETVTSSSARLTVTPKPLAPTVTSQPASTTVNEGQTASFTVVATTNNTALNYQWQRNGADIAGATAASYITPASAASDDAAQFTVAVSNSAGTTFSVAAVLTVRTPPRITAQPRAVNTFTGQTATFSVAATGTGPLQYQWQRNGTAIAGATAAEFSTPTLALADNGALYSVNISNTVAQVQSDSVALGVTLPPAPPSITTQPQDVTVLSGRTASFTVAAAGAATLTYQWQRNGVAISGANQASYTTPALAWTDTMGLYSVVVSNGVGNATSRAAALTVTPRVVEVGVGGVMGTARKEDGTVWGWGRSNTISSVLGNGGTPVAYGTMVKALNSNGAALNGVTQVSSGVGHTLALKTDGTLWAWGDNSEGAIGIGTVTSANQLFPAQVKDAAGNAFVGVAAVSGGWRFSLAMKADGTAWGWGWAVSSQLGNNNNPNTLPAQPRNFPSPVAVLATGGAPLSGVNQIVAGVDNGMARRNDGTVWIWGSGQFGQLGDGTVNTGALVAQRLNDASGTAITGVSQMAVGYLHAMVLLADGTALAWGANTYGELGDGSTARRTTPVVLKDAAGNTFRNIAALRAGDGCSAILRTDGTVWMVGRNVRGQLARSTATASVASPVQVFMADGTPLTGVVQIALFDNTVIVLRNDGTVWGWGDNADGELGFAPTNAVQLSAVPVKISVSGD